MGRTHINLLSTQKNVLAHKGGGVCMCVVSFHFPPPVTWKQDKAERKGKEKSKQHLYVKAHLSRGKNADECKLRRIHKH